MASYGSMDERGELVYLYASTADTNATIIRVDVMTNGFSFQVLSASGSASLKFAHTRSKLASDTLERSVRVGHSQASHTSNGNGAKFSPPSTNCE